MERIPRNSGPSKLTESERPPALWGRETGILLPNNQRHHHTPHAPKDVLPLRICANYCAPCQPSKLTEFERAPALWGMVWVLRLGGWGSDLGVCGKSLGSGGLSFRIEGSGMNGLGFSLGFRV